MFKTLQWEDWLGIGVGAWMLASPWILGYTDSVSATMNALFVGTFLVLAEMLDLDVHENAEERIDIAAGLWLIASPFVLGFSTNGAASLNAAAAGLVTIGLAAIALSPFDRQIARWGRDRAIHPH